MAVKARKTRETRNRTPFPQTIGGGGSSIVERALARKPGEPLIAELTPKERNALVQSVAQWLALKLSSFWTCEGKLWVLTAEDREAIWKEVRRLLHEPPVWTSAKRTQLRQEVKATIERLKAQGKKGRIDDALAELLKTPAYRDWEIGYLRKIYKSRYRKPL